MKIRILVGVTSLAALVTLTGVGCSSSDTETGDQDSGATTDSGGHDSSAHDGGSQQDTSAPHVDAGADAEIVPDSSTPVDASDAGTSDTGTSDTGTSDAGTSDAATKDASTDGAIADAAATDASNDASTDAGSDAANVSDASSSDATVTPDSGAHDAATDAKVFPPPDASDPDAANVCAPSDMSGFTPVWHPPVAHSTSCSAAQIAAYHQCLIDGETQANPASCAPFQGTTASAADKACMQCILTPDTASSYGAIIVHKGEIEINVAGCIAIATNDPQGAGCAGKVQASGECLNAACSANCPVVDGTSFQLEQACEAAAASGTCKPISDAAACTDGLVEAGGATATCLTGQTFDDLYDSIVPVFCGP